MAGMSSIVCNERYPQKRVGRATAHPYSPRLFTELLPCQIYNHVIWYSSRFLQDRIPPIKNQIVYLLLPSSPCATAKEGIDERLRAGGTAQASCRSFSGCPEKENASPTGQPGMDAQKGCVHRSPEK